MGFNAPSENQNRFEVLLDVTESPIAATSFGTLHTIEAAEFDLYETLWVELITEPSYAMVDLVVRRYLNESATRAFAASIQDNGGWFAVPVSPIGGKVTLRGQNIDTFNATIGVRVAAVDGQTADALRRGAIPMLTAPVQSVAAAATNARTIVGHPLLGGRLVGVAKLSQTSDVAVRWQSRRGSVVETWDEVVATGVAAGVPTPIDTAWKGTGSAQIRVTNTSGTTGSVATVGRCAAA